MRHTINLHFETAPKMTVDHNGGVFWIRLEDGADRIVLFTDLSPDVMERAADAFNAEIARGQSKSPVAGDVAEASE